MTDGSDKDVLMLAGTLAGFAAALLTIFERLLNIQDRLGQRNARQPSSTDERPIARSFSSPDFFEPRRFQRGSYLIVYETGVIIAAGVLLNYLGLTLSRHLQSILFLDMTGTALASFLLGPWWGAIVALLSNSVVNWLLYPEAGADIVIFPWSLVNMAGAFYWGLMARRASFRRYLKAGRHSILSHAWFLATFGVFGAMVTSIPGTWVQAALGEQAVFALNPEVAATLSRMVVQWEEVIGGYLQSYVGLAWGEHLGWAMVNWFQNCIRYIPDKTFSAAIALVVLKYGYPLFERELIHGGPEGERMPDERILPLILGLLYAPSCAALITGDQYAGPSYWPLWAAPWLGIAGGYVLLRYRGATPASLQASRALRAGRYAKALKLIGRESSYEFCRRLTLMTLIASLIFVLCLPILLVDFYRVAFNFFCVVYGFLLVVHLLRVAIVQNLSEARAEE